MALFDIFKKKKAEPTESVEQAQEVAVAEAPAVEQTEQTEQEEQTQQTQQEEITEGLKKTKEGFFGKLARAVAGRSQVDEDVLDELEEGLITSDVGVETTVKIIKNILMSYIGISRISHLFNIFIDCIIICHHYFIIIFLT